MLSKEGFIDQLVRSPQLPVEQQQFFCTDLVRMEYVCIKVNTIGVLQYEDFNNGGDGYTFWNMPYGGLAYQPVYECKWADPPGGKKASSAEDFQHDVNNRTWRDVFLEVNKDDIKDRLRDEYPSIKNSNGQPL